MPVASALCAPLVRHAAPCLVDFTRKAGARTVLDFGPVPLPKLYVGERRDTGQTCTYNVFQSHRAGDATYRTTPAETLAVTAFALSQLPPSSLSTLLDEIHAGAGHAIFLDFKVPERNIETPSALLFGAMRRFCDSKENSFHSFGGLEGLLYQESARFQVLERRTLLGGGLLCVLASCLP